MSLYYTTEERGNVTRLPIRSMHTKIIRQLFKSRRKNHRNQFVSSLKIDGYMQEVHVVFFCKKRKVLKIWDAKINGYRSQHSTKGALVPLSLIKKK